MIRHLAKLFCLALVLFHCSAPRCAQDPLDLLFLAQEWQAKGNFEAANNTLQDVLRQDPENVFAIIRLSQVQAVSGNSRAALDGLDKALRLEPENLLALCWRGHILLFEGMFQEADLSYQHVLSLHPDNGWGNLGAAAARLAMNKPGEAAPYLAKVQATAGEDALLHLALGDTFLRLGLFTNARLELERSLEINPRDVRALTLAGNTYMRLNLDGLAMNAWRQALALDPAYDEARFAILTSLGRQAAMAVAEGNRDEAIRQWRAMLGYDPQNSQALGALRNLK